VPWLKENCGRDIVTATVDTGGIDAHTVEDLRQRSHALGAIEHVLLNCKQNFFDDVIRYLIMGNIRRGQLYPLCVGAERGLQAAQLASLASARGATTVAHGCTAAGNDQVRFEVALRTLNPDLEVLAPVRDNNWNREEQLQYLQQNNLPLPAQGATYSINRGLWGTTIGGGETLTSNTGLAEEAWVLSNQAFSRPLPPSDHVITFEHGLPVALDGVAFDPVALIEAAERMGSAYGIGRGIHLGDTLLGTKGRVAFEAPAAEILIKTHRELEKLVLSAEQARVKDSVAGLYGELVHQGRQLDLACRDIEALLLSSQARVSGEVSFTLRPGNLFVTGTQSEFSLLAASRGLYGETAAEWTAAEVLGYSRLLSLAGILQTRAASGEHRR